MDLPKGFVRTFNSKYIMQGGDIYGQNGKWLGTCHVYAGTAIYEEQERIGNMSFMVAIAPQNQATKKFREPEKNPYNRDIVSKRFNSSPISSKSPQELKELKKKRDALMAEERKSERELQKSIIQIDDENYVLVSHIKYFYHLPYTKTWTELNGYTGKTIRRIIEGNAGISVGMIAPRFKSNKPYPFGY